MSTLPCAAELILILVLAWLILRERLTRTLIAFSLLAITGVVLVATIDVGVDQTSLLLGNGLILIGVACCVLYTVLTRTMPPRPNSSGGSPAPSSERRSRHQVHKRFSWFADVASLLREVRLYGYQG
jgi:drug/metabolite transporter (DMT)-like permease